MTSLGEKPFNHVLICTTCSYFKFSFLKKAKDQHDSTGYSSHLCSLCSSSTSLFEFVPNCVVLITVSYQVNFLATESSSEIEALCLCAHSFSCHCADDFQFKSFTVNKQRHYSEKQMNMR